MMSMTSWVTESFASRSVGYSKSMAFGETENVIYQTAFYEDEGNLIGHTIISRYLKSPSNHFTLD